MFKTLLKGVFGMFCSYLSQFLTILAKNWTVGKGAGIRTVPLPVTRGVGPNPCLSLSVQARETPSYSPCTQFDPSFPLQSYKTSRGAPASIVLFVLCTAPIRGSYAYHFGAHREGFLLKLHLPPDESTENRPRSQNHHQPPNPSEKNLLPISKILIISTIALFLSSSRLTNNVITIYHL